MDLEALKLRTSHTVSKLGKRLQIKARFAVSCQVIWLFSCFPFLLWPVVVLPPNWQPLLSEALSSPCLVSSPVRAACGL